MGLPQQERWKEADAGWPAKRAAGSGSGGSQAAVPGVPSLLLARLRVTLVARGRGRLPPYLGSTLRGAFGHAFRQVGCAMPDRCVETCRAPHRCAYAYIFETPVPAALRGRLGGPFAPHPFVFTPLDEGGEPIEPGRPLSFGMTLFGRGLRYFPHFLAAFEGLGSRGLGKQRIRFEVDEVVDGFDSEPRPLFDPREHRVLGSPTVQDLRQLVARAMASAAELPGQGRDLRIRLLTPLRLVRDGELSTSVELSLLAAALHRRLEALTLFHGDGSAAWLPPESAGAIPPPPEPAPPSSAAGLLGTPPFAANGWPASRARTGTEGQAEIPPPLPFPGGGGGRHPLADPAGLQSPAPPGSGMALRAEAEQARCVHADLVWAQWDRRSNRQHRSIEMDGIMGELSFRDVSPSVLAWLLAGQWLNAGKSTAFGLGRYAVDALVAEEP